jgi:hypothetical protein
MEQHRQILDETIAARAKALELLKSLTAAQANVEPSGKDLFKRVTGQSSIENSIAATRRAVEAYDRLIAQLESAAGAPQVTGART